MPDLTPAVPGSPDWLAARRADPLTPIGNCDGCWHLWAAHDATGCHAKSYPAHSLTGEPCPCTEPAPGARHAADLPHCPQCGNVNPADLGPVTDACLDGRACRRRRAGLAVHDLGRDGDAVMRAWMGGSDGDA